MRLLQVCTFALDPPPRAARALASGVGGRRFASHRRVRILSATVNREGSRRPVSFNCEAERTIGKPSRSDAVTGVDAGLRNLAALSTGAVVPAPGNGTAVAWALAGILLALVSYTDLRERRIPNWAVVWATVGGLTVAGAAHGLRGFEASLVGWAVGMAWWPAVFWLRLGEGDAKLAMSLGALLGPGAALGGPAAGYLLCAVALGPWIAWQAIRGRPWRDVTVPMAPWIAAGTVLVLVFHGTG